MRWSGPSMMLRTVAALCFLVVLFTISSSSPAGRQNPRTILTIDCDAIGSRPMVIVPHPDDEALATAGLISLALQKGSKPIVVVVTSGDASPEACAEINCANQISVATYREVGKLRCLETLNAMRSIGLTRRKIVFLGFADGSVNSLLDENWDRANSHTGINGCQRSPYRFSYYPGVPYSGENLLGCIKGLIKKYRPTSVFYPHPEDHHHDHWALNAFVQYALTDMRYETNEYTYIVHRKNFPMPKGYFPYHGILPPPELVRENGHWSVLPLNRRAVKLKKACIKFYTIPLSIIPELMLSFIRKNELFFRPEIPSLNVTERHRTRDGENGNACFLVDPEKDTCHFHEREVDIRGLSLESDRTKLLLSLRFAAKPSPYCTYIFRLRIFKGNRDFRIERIDAFFSRNTLKTRAIAGNSLDIKSGLEGSIRKNCLYIRLPARILKDASVLLVSADVFKNGKRADRCGWRRVKLES